MLTAEVALLCSCPDTEAKRIQVKRAEAFVDKRDVEPRPQRSLGEMEAEK